jgi:hypothetical protein
VTLRLSLQFESRISFLAFISSLSDANSKLFRRMIYDSACTLLGIDIRACYKIAESSLPPPSSDSSSSSSAAPAASAASAAASVAAPATPPASLTANPLPTSSSSANSASSSSTTSSTFPHRSFASMFLDLQQAFHFTLDWKNRSHDEREEM